jgi:hypothetical protein
MGMKRRARPLWRRSRKTGEGNNSRLRRKRAMFPRLGHVLYYLSSGLTAAALVSGMFVLQYGADYDYRWIAMWGPSLGIRRR